MIDYIFMLVILVLWGSILLVGASKKENGAHLFDKYNTNAMRGFWCIIVIIGHTPPEYVNPIQDLILCFGFVGITFFFMASGYGLNYAIHKKPEMINTFWRNRLPKILITGWVINFVFRIIYHFAEGTKITFSSIVTIDYWVKWLLFCYLLFWAAHKIGLKFIKSENALKISNMICMILVGAFSLTMYILKNVGVVEHIWVVECLGFIYGMLLCVYHDKFAAFFTNNWLKKIIVVIFISLVLGVAYLKLKPVLFFGDYLIKNMLCLALTTLIMVFNTRYSFGNKLNMYLGSISLDVYLIHEKMYRVMSYTGIHFSSGAFILTAIIVTLIAASIMHQLTSRVCKLAYKLPFLKG